MEEIKFDDWRLTAFWAGMTVAAAIAGFVFGWSWRDRPGALETVSVLSAMTAIGTVGATVAAVWIAFWQANQAAKRGEERRIQVGSEQRDRANRLAALAAAALEPRLKVIEDDVEMVLIGLQLYSVTDIRPETFHHLSNQFSGIDLAVPMEHLLLIEALPSGCADEIAAGVARLSKVRATMSRWREAMFDRSNTGEQRMRLVRRWSDEMSDALGAISSARIALEKAMQPSVRPAAFLGLKIE
ncbi:hypothetical protein ACXXNA_05860 [Bordetella bronchiseptica]